MSEEGGFWWWASWVLEVVLCVIFVPLMFSISALFNVVPWWGQDKMMGLGTAAMVIAMGGMPFGLKFVPWFWKVLGVALCFGLCYLLWQGAAEQISMARDSVSSGAQQKIKDFADLGTKITAKGLEKDGYVKALNWRVGNQDDVTAARTVFDNASTRQQATCKLYPKSNACTKATTEQTNAQGKLKDASDVLEWTAKVKALELEIPNLEQQQRDLNAPTADPQAVAAARTATWLNRFGLSLTGDNVKDNRPLDMAAVGEALSFIGPIFMFSLIHGLLSSFRSFLRLRHVPPPQPERVLPVPKPTQPVNEPVMKTDATGNETGKIVELRPARKASVEEWKDVCTTARKGGKCFKSEARSKYESWCKAKGEEPVGPTVFGNELKRLGVEKSDTDKRYYYGMILQPSFKVVKSI